MDGTEYLRTHAELNERSLEEKVKTSTRDCVMYYCFTRSGSEGGFFFVFMHFCLLYFKQIPSKMYKDPPNSTDILQIPETNTNA